MTERGRALLINALVFPGMGQLLILERRLPGAVLVGCSVLALIAMCVAFWLRLAEALSTTSLDPFEILESVFDVLRSPGFVVLLSVVILVLCWALSLLDVILATRAETAGQR